MPPPPEGLKPRATKGFRGLLKAKALWGLALALVFTSVALAAGYRCTPCKENHYCSKGISYECPSDRPVTFGTGAKSVDECFSCADRDGESYPYYDEISGDCVACWQIPKTTTPYWNGTACVPCTGNTLWDNEALDCRPYQVIACAFLIPHGNTTLCLTNSVGAEALQAPQSAAEETPEFLAEYGIEKVSSSYPDYWAGAMKYCQDKGLRLPTRDELASIINAAYGQQNTELWNYLKSGTTSTTSITGTIYLWSSAEYYSPYYAYIYAFNSLSPNGTQTDHNWRDNDDIRAICVQ